MQLLPPQALRGLVVALSLLGAVPLAAPPAAKAPPTLHDELNAWFRTAALRAKGEWGVAVADERGQLLWSVNATRPLIPASTVKLFTTGFARTVLGGDARQVTRVVGTGYVNLRDGAWVGTWALEVNGDPTLERPTRSGPMLRDLATQLAEGGIRRLSGPLMVQSAAGAADARYPAAWSDRHRGRRFAPLIGTITLNENLVSFTVAPGPRVGAAPRLVGAVPDGAGALLTVRAKTVEGARDRLRFLPAAGGRYVVEGTIGVRARQRTYTGTASDPVAVLDAAWEAALTRAGIEWVRSPAMAAQTATAAHLTLAEVTSAPLDSIAAEVNTRSVNLGAEALLRWAAPGDDAAERLTRHVQEVSGETYGVHFADGSGLSFDDRATAYSFVKYLANFPATPAGRNFPLLLPANGAGTLRSLSTSSLSPGVVRAKTGTLGNVSSLVGYLGHRQGMLLVSVLYNGPQVTAAKQQQWQLFRVLGASGSSIFGEVPSIEGTMGGDDLRAPPPQP